MKIRKILTLVFLLTGSLPAYSQSSQILKPHPLLGGEVVKDFQWDFLRIKTDAVIPFPDMGDTNEIQVTLSTGEKVCLLLMYMECSSYPAIYKKLCPDCFLDGDKILYPY